MKLEEKKTFHFIIIALFLCIGVVLHYFESWLSIPIGGYMLKVGISNIVVLIAIFLFGDLDGLFLSLVKIPLSMLLEPQFTAVTFFISLGGALLSIALMLLSKRFLNTGIIITSCIGGIFHNIGQLLVVLIIIKTFILIWYLPFLLVIGIFTGYLTGIVASFLVEKFNLLIHN